MAKQHPAHRRILETLAGLGHDRPDVLAAFARAALRRVPDAQLHNADVAATADRLAAAFDTIDRRRSDEVVVQILRPAVGLDGLEATPTIIEVVTEDRPFLLSTVVDELERGGHRVTRSLHPIIGVERDQDGRISAIRPARTSEQRESLIHLEVAGALPASQDEELTRNLRRLIADVLRTTDDHDRMRARVRAVADELRFGAWPHTDRHDADEVAALLDWLLDDNLVLLGVREYRVFERDGRRHLGVVPDSGLGLLSDTSRSSYDPPVAVDELPDEIQARLRDPPLLTVTRTKALSTVQRRVRMEYLGLSRRDESGEIAGEVRLLGLFTRKGFADPARATPVLREKLRVILEREDVVEGSYDEVTIASLFQALPKDELFQSDVDELHSTLVSLLHAEEHREVRTLARVDEHAGTVSVLVAVPRDRYSPELRQRIQSLLGDLYGTGRVDVEVALGDRQEALARFLLHIDGPIPQVPAATLQAEIRRLARSWIDALRGHLASSMGVAEAQRLLATVASRLPSTYRDAVSPDAAIPDVLLVDRVLSGDDDLLIVLQPGTRSGTARLRAAKRGEALELSSFLPILESLGLIVVEEIPHRLEGDGVPAQLHDLGVRAASIDVEADGPRIADAVLAAWRGHLEVDALNEVVLVAGVDWRDVTILRSYRRLRRQLGSAYTPGYVHETMVGHPGVVRALVDYIHERFDPSRDATPQRQHDARERVVERLDELKRLDHDRILRGLLDLVDATLRTNAFRPDAVADVTGEPYVAFKLDPSRLPGVGAPAPYREIFVHSSRMEGVHLRAGPVARGGLRWSDRRDDVRAEVLDLLKAQVLKNAVIVPTGAKGGFVVAREPADAAELRAEVRRQYVTFIRALLDVTDDLDGEEVTPPPGVVRHDGDDPYLVVAADRGTATLSDTANQLAARYGYWLDDAFASGGSNGYDHKALGVTARGAWLAVRRHFRELGIDVQTEPTTAIGVGDMSGDVFGNGMLLSRAVRLVGAFDHRDIFLDPDPDPEASFAERQRLFALPRSSWQDYDRSRISPGGGVFRRTSRSVALSDEVRQLLRIDEEEVSPPELIRAMLRAPVDLLFAGGIGTYVKASSEQNENIGDRSSQEVRVDANELRARVIGEGANLFITQRGRIEYARRGGHLNQDAVDNAAGVSTSDHEVNVKILLTLAQAAGALDQTGRDRLLGELTDEVLEVVLRDVDLQTAAISREVARSPERIDDYDLLLRRLETTNQLNRTAEILPSSADLAERAEAGAGLTRPELSTLLAWAKRDLKETLLESDAIDSPLLRQDLLGYFPRTLAQRFPELISRHRLRRELTATVVANDVVDRMGVTFVAALVAQTGRPPPDIVLAYRIARGALDAERWWALLEELEETHDPSRVRDLEMPIHRLISAVTVSLVTGPWKADPMVVLERTSKVAEVLVDGMLELGTAEQRRGRIAHARWLVDDLVHNDLARFAACALDLAMIPDVAVVLEAVGGDRAATDIADAFLRVGDALGIDRLESALLRTTVSGPWPTRQHRGLVADLRRSRRDAALAALRERSASSELDAVGRFVAARQAAIERTRAVIDAAERAEDGRLEAIAVAVRSVRETVEPST